MSQKNLFKAQVPIDNMVDNWKDSLGTDFAFGETGGSLNSDDWNSDGVLCALDELND